MTQKVVVTGLGIVSSLGKKPEIFWDNLMAGKNAVSIVSNFDTSRYPHHVGCEVKNFESDYISKAEKKIYGRASMFAIHATYEAIEN
ncbi:MAG: beta-ketoacyl synthase N-terminal-like domain-containing protein, partial [Nitrosotalea sp.]